MRVQVVPAAFLFASVIALPQDGPSTAEPEAPATQPPSPGGGGLNLAGLLGGLGLGGGIRGPKTSNYASYQMEIFTNGAMGQVPVVTTDPNKLEAQAQAKMSPKAFGFLSGGAGESGTLNANREAFKHWRIVPRMMAGGGPRNLSIELFGKRYPTPVMMAPIGFQHILHKDGEPGAAESASQLGIPYIMSGNSHASMEDIAKAAGDGERWYQLYWQMPDVMTSQTLQRAQAAGYRVLVVTLDAFQLGYRPADLDQGYMPVNLPDSISSLTGLGGGARRNISGEAAEAVDAAPPGLLGPYATWERLPWLRQNWKGPIVLKGIQHADDAKKALAAGMDGIIVSNHGGRQMDGGVGSLEVLPEIVDAVGDKMPVLFDSGIRTGADIIKALSLGARAVLVGRPWAYGMGINGKAGASTVMRGILAQLEINMNVAGLQSIKDMNRNILRKAVS